MKRRDFLKGAAVGGAMVAGLGSASPFEVLKPARQNRKSVAGLALPPMEKVRVGFIGVGARGSGHVEQMCALEGVEVKAICDLYQDWADRSAKAVVDSGQPAPALYVGDPYGYKKMHDRDDIDIVVISTPWEWHVPMAVDAMRKGKHAFIEVPAALTVEECWELVDTAEETQRHCMMMENVNYGREELMVLNLVRQGALGELLHGEAAYIHDLRWQMHEEKRGTGSWRTHHYMKTNGNLYPTHGLGPVAQYMNINRGDRFDYMSSVSCNARMREIYAEKNFPEGHKWRRGKFVCGDLNTSIIRTVLGKTIMVQWDEQLARPYTRHNLIQGTKGCWSGFPGRVAIEEKWKDAEGKWISFEQWEQGGELDKVYTEFDHPLFRKQGELAVKMGGHGGMDFLMLWRIVYCLRNGEPLDQDVYDAAAWSVVTPLSEWSVKNRGASVDFPDFTRGEWKTMKPLGIVDPKV
ncbi:alpha-N-acetylgalactosaminidase [Armatimonadetes bacterium Uphvl-Ar1]|nr:alpha-N-acetylgalactosaminidase [Armatimonadetes bacterium Uphvl-Ar1]